MHALTTYVRAHACNLGTKPNDVEVGENEEADIANEMIQKKRSTMNEYAC
jgi:hypothetical protein